MTDEQIAEARRVIGSIDHNDPQPYVLEALWAEEAAFYMAARHPETGWCAALDEVERLRARVAVLEPANDRYMRWYSEARAELQELKNRRGGKQ